MQNRRIAYVACVLALPLFGPTLSAQQPAPGAQAGTPIPEVTAGPGWKPCPKCQNAAHIKAAREKYEVEGHPFNPRDLSGVWMGRGPASIGIALDLKTLPEMTPYGRMLWEETQAVQVRPDEPPSNGGRGSKNPLLHCDPQGLVKSLVHNYGFEFVHLPDRVIQFFEWGGNYRTIWTDGRPLPVEPPQQQFYGYNVGRWEGDAFVIDSFGFDDRAWLDEDRRGRQRGFRHSDELRVRERWKRTSYATLDLELTITDAKVFVAPWVTHATIDLRPGTELQENLCAPTDYELYNREIIGLRP